MEIGQIGQMFSKPKFIDYLSHSNLLEYDLLLIDCSYLQAILNTSTDPQIIVKFIRRLDNLNEFLTHKPLPLVYFNLPSNFEYIVYGQRKSKQIQELFPLPNFERVSETGTKIEILAKTPLSDFLNKYKPQLSYKSYYKNITNATPLALTSITEKCLSFYNEKCLILPFLQNFESLETDILTDLYNSLIGSTNSHSAELIPDWVTQYNLPEESSTILNINELQNQIRSLELKVAEEDIKLKHFNLKKKLLYSSGKMLEKQVEQIFIELGFEILESEIFRDDLIVRFEHKIAVIEIKGVKKSAAEKHAAQLEKWASTYLEEKGVIPKGILIVNTFNETPLDERIEKSFPDQMIPYSISREHCLMTTVQLLSLSYIAKESSESRLAVIESIFNTIGELKLEKKWSEYICRVSL